MDFDNLKGEKILKKNNNYENNQDYLELEQKIIQKTINQNLKNILEFSFDKDDIPEKEKEFFLKTKEYNEKIQKEPNNPILWIEFLDYQEKSQFFARKTNERQIEIVNKALENPKLEKNLSLILYQLKLLENTENYMKNLMKNFENNIDNSLISIVIGSLILEYIATKFINLSSICFREEIEKILKLIKNSNSIKTFLSFLPIITLVENEMGFKELAYSIYESLIDFHIFSPVFSAYELKIKKFEYFWEKNSIGKGNKFSNWEIIENNDKENDISEEKEIKTIEEWVTIELADNEILIFEKKNKKIKFDSIILFDDIEKFIFDINKERLNDFDTILINEYLDFLNFPTLDNSFFPKIENNWITELFYEKIEEIFDLKKDLLHEINLFDNIDFFLKFPSFVQKINEEKIRKFENILFLVHNFYKINKNIQILYYIFYLEGVISIYKKIEKPNKILKDFLKSSNELNLWFIFCEIEFLRTGNLIETDKIYLKIFEFSQKKKKLICLYFWSSFYLRNYEAINLEKTINSLKIIFEKVVLLLNISELISIDNLIFLHKVANIFKKQHELLLIKINGKNEKKNRKNFPLSKCSIFYYFYLLALKLCYLCQNEIFLKNSNFLEKINFSSLSLKESRFEKNLFDSDRDTEEIQLLLINFFRILNLKYTSENLEIGIKKILSPKNKNFEEILEFSINKFPQNPIIIWQIILYYKNNSLSLNWLQKIKEIITLKNLSLSIWIMILLCESNYLIEKPEFTNKIERIFRFCLDDRLYNRYIEKIKSNKNIQIENHLRNLTKIIKLYQSFLRKFLNNDKKKFEILIHRLPYCKYLYLNYLQAHLSDPIQTKEIIKIIYSKEFRLYNEIPEF